MSGEPKPSEMGTDASAWAREFCKRWPSALCQIPGHEGIQDGDDFEATVLGWFANAIETAKDAAWNTRAGTAIPKAEADAMVAAAYQDAREVALDVAESGEYHGEASVDTASQIYRGGGQEVYDEIALRVPADARAAFEQAVREAEQRGWARGMEAKVHNAAEAAVREAVEAERECINNSVARIREQLKVNLAYFDVSNRSTLEILQSHIEDELRSIEGLSAIRTPQETSE